MIQLKTIEINREWLDAQYVTTNFGLEKDPSRSFIFYHGIGLPYFSPRLSIGLIYDCIDQCITDLKCFNNDSLNINFTDYPCDTTWQILSVNDANVANDFLIYPNPTSDKFKIELTKSHHQNHFRIIDLNVKQWKSNQRITDTEFSIDQYPSGVYIIQLLDDSGTILKSKKLIVIK